MYSFEKKFISSNYGLVIGLKMEEFMKTFDFCKEASILLYGAAAIGNIMYNTLSSQGYNVNGFVDKRADEITNYLGYPVWKIEEKSLDRNSIVIVSVKNVFEHEQIVDRLISNGFFNLIFKPLAVLNGNGTEHEKCLSVLYDSILENKVLENMQIKCTFHANIYTFQDYALYSEKKDEVIAKIPLEFVYTNNYTSQESKWGNINILSFFTHVHFFKFLLGDSDKNPEYYIDEYCIYTAPKEVTITEGWKKNVVRNRLMILEQMNAANELEPNFFLRNAPTAIWNSKGYFNLTSGKHRAAFFAAKNYKYIPLRVSKKDYELYCAKESTEKLIWFINDKYKKNITLPINNPFFYKYPLLTNEYYYSFLAYYSDYIAVRSYFSENILEWNKITFLEKSNDLCGVGGHFSRMGSNVYKILNSEDNIELFELIQETLHIPAITLVPETEIDRLAPDYFFIESNDQNLITTYANRVVSKNLIVTCDIFCRPKIEGYQFISTGITAYKQECFIHTLNYEVEKK